MLIHGRCEGAGRTLMVKGPLFNRRSFSSFFTSGQSAAGSEMPIKSSPCDQRTTNRKSILAKKPAVRSIQSPTWTSQPCHSANSTVMPSGPERKTNFRE